MGARTDSKDCRLDHAMGFVLISIVDHAGFDWDVLVVCIIAALKLCLLPVRLLFRFGFRLGFRGWGLVSQRLQKIHISRTAVAWTVAFLVFFAAFSMQPWNHPSGIYYKS